MQFVLIGKCPRSGGQCAALGVICQEGFVLIGLYEVGKEFTEDVRPVFIVRLGAALAVLVYERPIVSRSFVPAKNAVLLEAHLREHDPYEAVFITHNETSTGIVNPIADLIPVARQYGDPLICVDAVSSMAGVSIPVDELGIDYCVTSSQKCFSLPPGLSFASVSPRCLETAATIEDRGWYLDLLNLRTGGRATAKDSLTSAFALTITRSCFLPSTQSSAR